MVEGSMVKHDLNKDMIDAGKVLIKKLIDQDHQLTAALWFYFSDTNIWRLILASQIVKAKGPRAMYEKVQSVIRASSDEFPSLELSNITVVSPDDNIITQFESVLLMAGFSGTRISNDTISGRVIEDAFIYNIAHPKIVA